MGGGTDERTQQEREWRSIDRWVQAKSMSAAPESTASDHYYIDGFNAGLREAAAMWREERERWAQQKDVVAEQSRRLAELEQILRFVDADVFAGEPCPICAQSPHSVGCGLLNVLSGSGPT